MYALGSSQVVRSLSSSAVCEGETEEEQYPFGEAPTEDDVCTTTHKNIIMQIFYVIM